MCVCACFHGYHVFKVRAHHIIHCKYYCLLSWIVYSFGNFLELLLFSCLTNELCFTCINHCEILRKKNKQKNMLFNKWVFVCFASRTIQTFLEVDIDEPLRGQREIPLSPVGKACVPVCSVHAHGWCSGSFYPMHTVLFIYSRCKEKPFQWIAEVCLFQTKSQSWST